MYLELAVSLRIIPKDRENWYSLKKRMASIEDFASHAPAVELKPARATVDSRV